MVSVSLLGIPHDDNSSFMKGAAEAPPLIRRELHSDAYSIWSESGSDLGAPGRLIDHGDGRTLECGPAALISASIVWIKPARGLPSGASV